MPHLTTYIFLIVIIAATVVDAAPSSSTDVSTKMGHPMTSFLTSVSTLLLFFCVYSHIQSLDLVIILFQWLFFIQLL